MCGLATMLSGCYDDGVEGDAIMCSKVRRLVIIWMRTGNMVSFPLFWNVPA